MNQATYIYAARFQPFHQDHMEIVKAFLSQNAQPLVVAIVRPLAPDWLTQDEFDQMGNEHHDARRNPFTALEVMCMVNAALHWAGVSHRTILTLLPRPARGPSWKLIDQLLPSPRSWIIPQRGEDWDECKAEFFQQQGDSVLRIVVTRTASGQAIRAKLVDESHFVIEAVPEGAREVLRSLLAGKANRGSNTSPR